MIAPTLQPLADLHVPDGPEPRPGFVAEWQGEYVTVTAVLDRTAVVVGRDGEKCLARKADVLVDPARLTWYQAPSRSAISFSLSTSRTRANQAARGRRSAQATARKCACGKALAPNNRSGVCPSCRQQGAQG